MTTNPAGPTTSTPRRTPAYVHIAAWAVPTLVLGNFALLAVVPVAMIAIGSRVDARVRTLRWPAGLLASAYALPLALWILNPERAQSLSKDINPGLAALIVAASAVLLVTVYMRRTR